MSQKYRYILLILLFAFSYRCGAQQDEKALMPELVDLFNYHTVKFMLVSGTENESSFTYSFYTHGTKYSTNDTAYWRIYNSIPASLSKTRVLCAEIESLKTRLPGGLTIQKLCTYLIEGMYLERKKNSYSSNYYYPALNTFFTQWKNRDAVKFSQFTTNLLGLLRQKANSNDKENNKKPYDYNVKEYKKKSIFTNMAEWITEHMGIVTCILLFLIWLAYINAGSKAEKKASSVHKKTVDDLNKVLAAYRQEISGMTASGTNQQLLNERNEERLQKLEAETFAGVWAAYLELKDHTNQLTARLKLLETKQPPTPEKKKETTATFQPVTTSTVADTATQRKLFFPVPDKKTGHFRAVLGKDNISGYTVYQFIIDKKEADKAAFSLIRTPQVEAAVLNFPEAYLLHACNTEGTPGINKKIGTIDAGIAQLEGEYWVIQKKALIRYV